MVMSNSMRKPVGDVGEEIPAPEPARFESVVRPVSTQPPPNPVSRSSVKVIKSDPNLEERLSIQTMKIKTLT